MRGRSRFGEAEARAYARFLDPAVAFTVGFIAQAVMAVAIFKVV